MPQTVEAIALYDYDGSEPGSLRIEKGDILEVVSKADGWWYCVNSEGDAGYCPSDYLTDE
jgi:hypothetical protein